MVGRFGDSSRLSGKRVLVARTSLQVSEQMNSKIGRRLTFCREKMCAAVLLCWRIDGGRSKSEGVGLTRLGEAT